MKDCLFIRDGKECAMVRLKDIRYIAGDKEYLSLHVCGRAEALREKSSFAAIRLLLNDSFLQIHRSCIINTEHLGRVGRGYVLMDDGTRLQVADARREELRSLVDPLTVGKVIAQ